MLGVRGQRGVADLPPPAPSLPLGGGQVALTFPTGQGRRRGRLRRRLEIPESAHGGRITCLSPFPIPLFFILIFFSHSDANRLHSENATATPRLPLKGAPGDAPEEGEPVPLQAPGKGQHVQVLGEGT